jgi:hypothetical protein
VVECKSQAAAVEQMDFGPFALAEAVEPLAYHIPLKLFVHQMNRQSEVEVEELQLLVVWFGWRCEARFLSSICRSLFVLP